MLFHENNTSLEIAVVQKDTHIIDSLRAFGIDSESIVRDVESLLDMSSGRLNWHMPITSHIVSNFISNCGSMEMLDEYFFSTINSVVKVA